MKLNIYEKNKVVKTYEADTYLLKFGIIEDVANAVNLDGMETGSNAEFMKMAIDLVIHNLETVKEFLKDIFDGITDEEIRNCAVKEMALVIVDVLTYTMRELSTGSRGN